MLYVRETVPQRQQLLGTERRVATQSAASETFGPNSRAAAEELLAAVEESNRRKSASDGPPRVSADMQALVRDSRRQSQRMPTTSPIVPERRPSIGAPGPMLWAAQPAPPPLTKEWRLLVCWPHCPDTAGLHSTDQESLRCGTCCSP